MSSLKEMSIRDYISKINFKTDDWKLSQIKEDMRKFLGEEPGIEVIYEKKIFVNEILGEANEYKDVSKIQIIFTDLDNHFKKLEFLVDTTI